MSGWGGATNFVLIGDDEDDDTPQVVEPTQELNEDTKTKFETKMFSEPGKFHRLGNRKVELCSLDIGRQLLPIQIKVGYLS